MVGEGTTAIFVTFLLALVGYAGLTSAVLLSLREAVSVRLWRAVAVVIAAHVGMVWTYRYGWQFGLAVRNGYTGFVLFNGALAMVIAATVTGARLTRILIRLAFGVVTVGAIGASFRYDVVAIYRIPVLLCAMAGTTGLLWAGVRKRRVVPGG